MKDTIPLQYQHRAREFIDNLFNLKYFNPEIKREDMRDVEKLLAFVINSNVELAIRAERLLKEITALKLGGKE